MSLDNNEAAIERVRAEFLSHAAWCPMATIKSRRPECHKRPIRVFLKTK